MRRMLELLLGQIPEAIFFSLFMIYAKNLKEKRLLFIVLMIIQYLLLKSFIHFNIWFQVIYTFMVFVILKLLYKKKAQITDIFTFSIASIVMIITNFIIYMIVWKLFNVFIIYAILNRLFLLLFIIIFHNKLYNIQKLYKKLWNRNNNTNKHIKTTTFRSINIIFFNIMFYIINIGMMFMIFQKGVI